MKCNESSELLEPRLSVDQGKELLVKGLLAGKQTKPNIGPIGPSSALDKVRSFLPMMQVADIKLAEDIKNGKTDEMNIENVENDERVVEMQIGMMETDTAHGWTSDSESDSTPSSGENDFTSDTEVSSSSSSSSASSSGQDSPKLKPPSSNARPRKRPIIEVLESKKNTH